jgi:hypothetical protein
VAGGMGSQDRADGQEPQSARPSNAKSTHKIALIPRLSPGGIKREEMRPGICRLPLSLIASLCPSGSPHPSFSPHPLPNQRDCRSPKDTRDLEHRYFTGRASRSATAPAQHSLLPPSFQDGYPRVSRDVRGREPHLAV